MEQDQKVIEQREQVIAFLLALAGLFALFISFTRVPKAEFQIAHIAMSAALAGLVILADHFPIHLTRGTKISMISLPIYLGAVFLPAPLAVLTAGFGICIAEIRSMPQRGTLPRDIAATTGQWMTASLVGSLVMNLNIPGRTAGTASFPLLVATALTFLVMDFTMFSLTNSFILREPFWRVLRTTVSEGIGIEGAQYLIAILGALAAAQEPWAIVLVAVPGLITYFAFKSIKEVKDDTLMLLEDMADTVDLRDVYTGGHSRRVADLTRQTLSQLKIYGLEAEIIETAARLHDIGKIGIPDEILQKPGHLTPEEIAIMQTHSQKGAELLSKYKNFSRGVSMIMHHHERWDGKGYPAGLSGYAIPFGARIIAVADSYDAMTSDRPYRSALSERQAIQVLLEGRGKQWDTNVVNAFVDMMTGGLESSPQETPARQGVLPLVSKTIANSS
jgi:putative nucleotidyltransferase with HDIG domain